MSSRAQRTILLAEDHADSREMLAVMLEMDGYRVVRAQDGVEALDLARSDAPDLIITDVNMPRMNGIDLIRAIRSVEDGLSAVPIVAITAYGSSFCLEARDAGANEALAKPLGYENVQEVVSTLLLP
jgi:two-component system, chemotaxis family, chemotaxis protein CheY